MGRKLYVGNLPYSATEDDIKAIFQNSGTVTDVHIVLDRMTSRSRGFAFVEMSTDEEAQAAIDANHQKDYEGRPLVVNEARPREPRPPRGDFGGGGGGYGGGGGHRGGGGGGGGGGRGKGSRRGERNQKRGGDGYW